MTTKAVLFFLCVILSAMLIPQVRADSISFGTSAKGHLVCCSTGPYTIVFTPSAGDLIVVAVAFAAFVGDPSVVTVTVSDGSNS